MSELKVNSIKGLASDLPENLKPVTASAWVNFNGTGVVAIRNSFNVSSITDVGVGNYTVNLTTAVKSGACVLATSNAGSTSNSLITLISTQVLVGNSAGTPQDATEVFCCIFSS